MSVKKKTLILITVCLAIALCVAGVGVAFAWYSSSVGADNQLELDADGFLVVYFDENQYDLDAIKPAVAVKGAITNNAAIDFDNLDVLNADGVTVAVPATEINHSGLLSYLNQSDDDSPKAEIAFSCEAYMVFADGSKEKLSLRYDLSVKIALSWVYVDTNGTLSGDNGESALAEGSENTHQIDNDDWWDNDKKANTKFKVDGSANITVNTNIYLRQVDDLCYPLIREAEKLQVIISAVVTPESEAGNA